MNRRGPDSTLRLVLSPRWVAAGVAVLVFAVAALLLGRWQWDRTQSILAAERAAHSEPVAIEEAVTDNSDSLPAGSIGRRVLVSGQYVPQLQVAVTNRERAGEPGVWVVTGLELADGRVVAVLRGWLRGANEPAMRVPPGQVTVHGVLQPDETFYAQAQTAPGTVVSIAHDRLAQLWGVDMVPGFVVLTAQDPQTNPAPAPVEPTVQTGDVDFPLQHFVYAFQWWLFALFAVAVFARWLWVERRRRSQLGGYGEAP